MKCPTCGAENLPGAKFCSQCGARLPFESAAPMLRCAACGHENPAGSRFCGECGAPLTAPAPAYTSAAPAASPTPPPQPAYPPPLAATPEPPPFHFVSASGAVIRFPPKPSRVWLIGREDPVSGIYPDVDLSPYDPERTVSRRHAELSISGREVVLTSLTTTNWTKVNDERLPPNRSVVLQDGDVIQFARCIVTFRFGG
ncbi:MAG: zinc ribbon domain-containing protein [Thermoflexales bacterium]|nr:zinc ribbon domain-containing protein [Thermoflexales bacterium]MCS7325260.1 zinc ribbon domain-containing protein [Thermoflexales bacterium]MDW8053571.1 zinc ribbon domain-containing protein [Anaerolineae bacterium]MDW8292133.1 zinc ribbon domain-containing protein [Anaerolineae bacterium]